MHSAIENTPTAEHRNGSSAKPADADGPRAPSTSEVLFVPTVASLALRRLTGRLEAAFGRPGRDGQVVSGRQFLEDRRAAVAEALHQGVHRACLALEVALRGEPVWDRLAAAMPREPRQLLLPQAWALRDAFLPRLPSDATFDARLVDRLRDLRRSASVDRLDSGDGMRWAESSDGAPDAGQFELEPRVAGPLAEALRQHGEDVLARLLETPSRVGDLLIVGLTDYFVCRTLQADPRVGGDFVFVHLHRPEELWDGDLEVLARVLEQQSARVIAALDNEPVPEPADSPARANDPIDRLFQLGLESYLAGDYSRALVHFTAALRLDSDNASLYAYRGDSHRLLCEYDLALADYSEALKLSPCAPVFVQRGTVYRLKGDLPRAIADCTAAIELDAKQTGAYVGRGDAHLDQGSLDAAIADYSIAIDLQPYSPWAHFGRGQAYYQKGSHEAAIADFGRVLALNPHHVPAQLSRADACRRMGNFAQAILDYSEVLRLHPRNAQAYACRGLAYDQSGDAERAQADYCQALRLDPKKADVYTSRGALLRRKGNHDRALDDLDESIRLDGGNAGALLNRGLIFMARGLVMEALADFDDALRLGPSVPAGYLFRALAQDRLSRFPEGIQDCSRALRLDPRCAAAYVVRGMIGARAGHHAPALADLTEAITLDPGFPLAYHERGMVHMLQENYESAGADYTQMLELNPGSAIGYVMRGLVFQMQGDHAQAVADFGKALEINPKSILAGWNPGLAEGVRRRTTELLTDYIEGVWPRMPEGRTGQPRKPSVPRRREPSPVPVPPPLPGEQAPAAEAPTDDFIEMVPAEDVVPLESPPPVSPPEVSPPSPSPPPANPPPATPQLASPPTLSRPAVSSPTKQHKAIAAHTASAKPTSPTIATDATIVDNSAAEIWLQIDPEPTTLDGTQAPAATEEEPPKPTKVLFQCPTCKTIAEPSERLPDRRVRCPECKAAFLPTPFKPTETPRPQPTVLMPTKTSPPRRPIPAMKQRTAVEDDGGTDHLRLTLTQKISLFSGTAAIILLLAYFFGPSWAGLESMMTTIPPAPEPQRVTAEELLREFVKDSKAAQKRFSQRTVVTGEVAAIEKGNRVRFKARIGVKYLEAYFTTAPEGVQPNQKISALIGEVDGWNRNALQLVDCQLVADKGQPPAEQK